MTPATPALENGLPPPIPDEDIASIEEQDSDSGVIMIGGSLFRNQDYNADLNGQRGCLVYEKMRRSDPDVASGLSRIIWPLLSASWEFDPAEDTDQGRADAAFCNKWIFGVGRKNPFAMNKHAFLRHAMHMLSDGVSAFEKLRATDMEGNDVFGKLVPIMPKTISEFVFEDKAGGEFKGIKQQAWIKGKGWAEAFVRAEKLMIFTFGREGDNMFGWPLLRAAFKPWYHKELIEIIDSIRIERNGVGFTVITIPKGSKAAVREAAKKVAAEVRVGERMGAIVEEGTTIQILYPTGNDPRIVESLQFLRSQILQVLLSEFVEHGTGDVGSHALVSTKIDLLMLMLQGLGAEMCDVINRQGVAQLMGWNSDRPNPVCKVDEISRRSVAQLVEWLAKAVPIGMEMDPELQQHIRESGKVPLIPEEDMKRLRIIHDKKLDMMVKMADQPPPEFAAPVTNGKPDLKVVPRPSDGEPASERPPKREAQLEPGPFWREPYAWEASADWPAMKSHLMSEPLRLWKIIDPLRKTMAWVAAKRFVAMSNAELASTDSISAIPLQRKMREKLEAPFLATYMKGRTAVRLERKRQLVGAGNIAAMASVMHAVMEDDEYDDEDEDYPTEPTVAQRNYIMKTLVGLFVLGLIQGMHKVGTDEALKARTPGATERDQRAKVFNAISGLSAPNLIAELAGDLNRAFATGRNDQARGMGAVIEKAYYSAMMDDGTCDECALLDGDEHELDDPEYATPNPDCPGKCRCVTVHTYIEDAAEAQRLREAFNPDQPRVPAGSGDDSGEWTSGGGGGGGGKLSREKLIALAKQHAKEHSGPLGSNSDTVNTLQYPMRQSEEAFQEIEKVVAASDFDSAVTAIDSQTEWQGAWATAEKEWLAANALGGNGVVSKTTLEEMHEVPNRLYAHEKGPNMLQLSEPQVKAFEARREWMQSKFREEYGEEVVVWRGVGGAYAKKIGGEKTVELPSYALSSWTTSQFTASEFAKGKNGVLLRTTIKPNDVWLLPRRGVESPIRIADAASEVVILNTGKTRTVDVYYRKGK